MDETLLAIVCIFLEWVLQLLGVEACCVMMLWEGMVVLTVELEGLSVLVIVRHVVSYCGKRRFANVVRNLSVFCHCQRHLNLNLLIH